MRKTLLILGVLGTTGLVAGCFENAQEKRAREEKENNIVYVYHNPKASANLDVWRVERIKTTDGLYCYSPVNRAGFWCREIPAPTAPISDKTYYFYPPGAEEPATATAGERGKYYFYK